MTTDTTPSAPSAASLARALALIDSFAPSRAEPVLFAVFAVARAGAGLLAACDAVLGPTWRTETLGAGEDGDDLNVAWDELDAAVAALCALAAPAEAVAP